MEKGDRLTRWIKNHEKELAVAGFSATALFLIIVGIKRQSVDGVLKHNLMRCMKQPIADLGETVSQGVAEMSPKHLVETGEGISRAAVTPFMVRAHIRNLPAGWKASNEKIEEALHNDIILGRGQTLVREYEKGRLAA